MIGDTRVGDLARTGEVDVTKAIVDHLAELERVRAGWAAELAGLEAQGVDEAVPAESWETRNGGSTKYLRLVYPTRQDGRRRKVYVGADPAKIEAARARVARRQRWQELSENLVMVDRTLAYAVLRLGELELALRNWCLTWGQVGG